MDAVDQRARRLRRTFAVAEFELRGGRCNGGCEARRCAIGFADQEAEQFGDRAGRRIDGFRRAWRHVTRRDGQDLAGSVTRTVCSPLGRRAVVLGDDGPAVGQFGDRRLPALIMGSMVKIMPAPSSPGRCRACRSAAPADPRGSAADAVPQNSGPRKTVADSAWRWIAAPMSPRRPPGFTWSMPIHMHSEG